MIYNTRDLCRFCKHTSLSHFYYSDVKIYGKLDTSIINCVEIIPCLADEWTNSYEPEKSSCGCKKFALEDNLKYLEEKACQ